MNKVEKIKAEIKRRKSLAIKRIIHIFCKKRCLCGIIKFYRLFGKKSDCIYNHTKHPQITIGRGTKIRSKTNPDVILGIIFDDCHEDKFE